MELFLDALIDALIDSSKMLPFLFLAYLLIEWLERNHGQRNQQPQAPGAPTPLLAAEPGFWGSLLLLVVLKVVFGMAAGFVLDVPLRRFLPRSLYGGYAGHPEEIDCHEEHEESSGIWASALRPTLEIFAFILLFSVLLGLLFEGVGEEPITAFLASMGPFQPMAAALVGLIPNCAASVLLAQLYVQGAISFGSLFAGLCAGAGIGLAVGWRVNPRGVLNLVWPGGRWGGGRGVGSSMVVMRGEAMTAGS